MENQVNVTVKGRTGRKANGKERAEVPPVVEMVVEAAGAKKTRVRLPVDVRVTALREKAAKNIRLADENEASITEITALVAKQRRVAAEQTAAADALESTPVLTPEILAMAPEAISAEEAELKAKLRQLSAARKAITSNTSTLPAVVVDDSNLVTAE